MTDRNIYISQEFQTNMKFPLYMDMKDVSVYNNARNLTFEVLNGTDAHIYITKPDTLTANSNWPEQLMYDFPGRIDILNDVPSGILDNKETVYVRFLNNVTFAYRRSGQEIIVNNELMKFTNRRTTTEQRTTELKELVKPDKKVVIFGSVNESEFNIVTQVARELLPDYNVLIAPRYVEPSIVEKLNLSLRQREISVGNKTDRATFATNNAIVLDTVGELRDFYSIADTSVIGGGLSKNNSQGSHNPLESLVFGVPTIIGDNAPRQNLICRVFGGSKYLLKSQSDNPESLYEKIIAGSKFRDNPIAEKESQDLESLLRISSNNTREAIYDIVKIINSQATKQPRQQRLKF